MKYIDTLQNRISSVIRLLLARIISIVLSVVKSIRSLVDFFSARRNWTYGLLGSFLALWWLWYSYNKFEFPIFISYCALLVAAIAALATLLSLKYTRDTVRPYLSFTGTIRLGNTTLAFPITNTGPMPANDVTVIIDPFDKSEDIDLKNASKRFSHFFDKEAEPNQEALILFPNQTWQSVFSVNFNSDYQKELWEALLNGNVILRVTILYTSFRRKHKTIQTLEFDYLSLSEDKRRFHGISVKPQKWL